MDGPQCGCRKEDAKIEIAEIVSKNNVPTWCRKTGCSNDWCRNWGHRIDWVRRSSAVAIAL